MRALYVLHTRYRGHHLRLGVTAFLCHCSGAWLRKGNRHGVVLDREESAWDCLPGSHAGVRSREPDGSAQRPAA